MFRNRPVPSAGDPQLHFRHSRRQGGFELEAAALALRAQLASRRREHVGRSDDDTGDANQRAPTCRRMSEIGTRRFHSRGFSNNFLDTEITEDEQEGTEEWVLLCALGLGLCALCVKKSVSRADRRWGRRSPREQIARLN